MRPAPAVAETLATIAHPLLGSRDDYGPLLDLVGQARIVLLGEASHGTREFYHERSRITKRLIQELEFNAVAVEADWPDAYRVNRYLRDQSGDVDAEEALAGFRRFPAWLWRNTEILQLVAWLRARNDRIRGREPETGFYGLDLYSLHASIEAVLTYLDRVDPEAAARARERYGCFDGLGRDPGSYGYAASTGLIESCEDDVVGQLVDLRDRREKLLRSDGLLAADEFFHAEQNARVVKEAEQYYRTTFRGQVASWNLRDTHMADTLDALLHHLEGQTGAAKIVVWAHNSHVGDARATELGDQGELNLGQLARDRHGEDVVNVGFSTYGGTVTAARDWGAPAERFVVRPALPGSFEELMHETGVPRMFLDFRHEAAVDALHPERLQRAIGVIYRPDTERQSHYFYSHLAEQFDALIHWDLSRALEPIDHGTHWTPEELPETWPTGI